MTMILRISRIGNLRFTMKTILIITT